MYGFLYFHGMIKRLIPLVFVLVACGSGEKTPFCECMEAGGELNSYSAKILDKGTATVADEKKMKSLKEAESKACKDYLTMGGPEMLELKRECAEMSENDPSSESK